MNPMKRMASAYAEIEAEEKERMKEADALRRAEEALELKQHLRSRFLTQAGATEEEFESMYPKLLADHRRQQMSER